MKHPLDMPTPRFKLVICGPMCYQLDHGSDSLRVRQIKEFTWGEGEKPIHFIVLPSTKGNMNSLFTKHISKQYSRRQADQPRSPKVNIPQFHWKVKADTPSSYDDIALTTPQSHNDLISNEYKVEKKACSIGSYISHKKITC